jgi:hypothetical protein
VDQPLWAWSGGYVGYRSGDDLWSHDGRLLGRFRGEEIFGPDGRYLGEQRESDRLITRTASKHKRGPRFTPRQRGVRGVRGTRGARGIVAGFEDFPRL